MKKITKLTAAQEARFPEFVRKWIEIGLSTQPADRARAARAISSLYRLAKLKEPRIIWLPCPISAGLSAVVYARINKKKKAVDSLVRSAVGSAVHSAVRSAVDSVVYSAVGSAVGSAVYSAVGSAVYSAVDSAVRSAVGSADDSAVYSVGRSFFGGSLWSGYGAWADYFNEVCGVVIDRSYLETQQTCGFFWTLDDVCFASERPSEIHRDSAGRLHSEHGLAIRYAGSGWGLAAWHGVVVPREWIEKRADLDPNEVIRADNVEQRAAGASICGWPKMLSVLNAKTIDAHANPEIGELIELTLPGLDEPGRFLKARCPRNGLIVEGVPRISDIDGLPIDTAIAAQAWRRGWPKSRMDGVLTPPRRT